MEPVVAVTKTFISKGKGLKIFDARFRITQIAPGTKVLVVSKTGRYGDYLEILPVEWEARIDHELHDINSYHKYKYDPYSHYTTDEFQLPFYLSEIQEQVEEVAVVKPVKPILERLKLASEYYNEMLDDIGYVVGIYDKEQQINSTAKQVLLKHSDKVFKLLNLYEGTTFEAEKQNALNKLKIYTFRFKEEVWKILTKPPTI